MATSKESPVLRAALEYAARGWRVFPVYEVSAGGGCECGYAECDKPGKHPALKGWPTEATTSPGQIRAWWGEKPRRGVGIATGEETGVTVLDVDGEVGVEELSKLSEGVMPTTPTVQSRAGRYHYYFRYAPGVRNSAKKLGEKLDTRSNGGYVVAPPSRHATGGVYTWLQAPSSVDLAEWPTFLRPKTKEGAKKEETRGRPPKETFNPANPKAVSALESALEYLDADDEERWAQVGWILGRAFRQADRGYVLYNAWAGKSKKFNPKRTKAHYYTGSKSARGAQIRTVASVFGWAKEAGWPGADDPEETDDRSFHVYENPYREGRMVEEMGAAAGAAEKVFLMGMRLVHIVMSGTAGVADVGVRRDPMSYVVLEHTPNTLAVELEEVAAYWARGDKGTFVRGEFKRQKVNTFLECHQFAGIKPLLAFVPHPTLRADGTLMDSVGYDPASQLYLTSRVEGLRVEAGLSRAAARRAMEGVMEPFSEYPWAGREHRAVFVAALFTVGLRHLFDVVPLFAFSSPKHGSGKTQLAECLSRLWYGTMLSKATWTPNPEEMEKRIAAFLLAGDRMVCLDNVTEGLTLEDSTLNKVLTSRRNTFRILGRTERVELTNEATWFATGNQLQLSGDISRRALLCYLDARMADPGSRTFKIASLENHIADRRAELMGWVLSVVASWIKAGKPVEKEPERGYGSFTEWYDFIRPLLLWVGEADIASAINVAQEADDQNESLQYFANELRKLLPPDSTAGTPATGILRLIHVNAPLREAFNGCTAHELNLSSLGALLRRAENKIFLSDNPGHEFSFKKRFNPSSKSYFWVVEYLSG